MKTSSDIFRSNDIRGVYKKDFDLEFCLSLAKSLSFLLKKDLGIKKPRVLVGQDARLSSPEIAGCFSEHLKNEGIDVASPGILPSPLCYFLLHHYDFDAVVVVTASHNPPEYNGFKFLIHKKLCLHDPMPHLKKIWGNSLSLKRTGVGEDIVIDSFTPYLKSLKQEFSFSKKYNFVVDTGNGALGPLAKKSFELLGLNPIVLFSEPDGTFPNHHPDPTIEENLKSLKTKIKNTNAQFGVAFDGDGDRLVIVTAKGETILGDELSSVFISSLLKDSKNKTIVADVKCSNWFFDLITSLGGKAVMSKSGHGLIRQEMHRQQSLAAFEFSGHFFFNDRTGRGFDDGLYAFFRLLEVLESQSSLEDILPKINTFKTDELRVFLAKQDLDSVMEKIKKYLIDRGEQFSDIDGIRISRSGSWALFRKSTTQDVLTLRFESTTEKEFIDIKNEFSKFVDF